MYVCTFCMLFFFKQQPAYELRISDWSSDVCSSDLSSADPRLVGEDKARKIGRTNYDVADQLANLGMEAIHPGAGRGLRQTDIPLRVRNTFDREDGGTL